MEDCCIVCAEPLEWIGYGPCGHRDVCSICIARIRFVLNDKCCCICKQECDIIYVTKALGGFTNLIGDFKVLPQRSDLWFESDIQAYFDDDDHYRMIKAMCRLSCRICDQGESVMGASKGHMKQGFVYRTLDLLQRHLQNDHKVQMCSLCLEGRKVFICEQQLFTEGQLKLHLSHGNSEVDGISDASGGFTGHPLCSFCQKRFYSDNELYQHMSRDHYTCHICDRLHPGRYDYYNNYGDLEAHFRYEHFMCEHSDCLAKKFVVFVSESELKKHNALEHGSNMSRAQRNAALQIPVSFQFRYSGRQNHESGRSRGRYFTEQTRDVAENEDNLVHERRSLGNEPNSFSDLQALVTCGVDSLQIEHGSEAFRYRAAVGGSGPSLSSLGDAAFPPLPSSSRNARRKAKRLTERIQTRAHGGEGNILSNNVRHEDVPDQWSHACGMRQCRNKNFIKRVPLRPPVCPSEDSSTSGPSVIGPSSSGVSRNGVVVNDEFRAANKVLIDQIRQGLGGNEDCFTAFRDISAQFRKDKLDVNAFVNHVRSFGLEHLIPEIARLCPDPDKRMELLETYKERLICQSPFSGLAAANSDNIPRQISISKGSGCLRPSDSGGMLDDQKGKKKTGESHSPSTSTGIRDGRASESVVKELPEGTEQPLSLSEEEVWTCEVCTLVNKKSSIHCDACGSTDLNDREDSNVIASQPQGKRKKKTPKFERARIQNGQFGIVNSTEQNITTPLTSPIRSRPSGRGVWRNGGGQHLVAMVHRESIIESAWKK